MVTVVVVVAVVVVLLLTTAQNNKRALFAGATAVDRLLENHCSVSTLLLVLWLSILISCLCVWETGCCCLSLFFALQKGA